MLILNKKEKKKSLVKGVRLLRMIFYFLLYLEDILFLKSRDWIKRNIKKEY